MVVERNPYHFRNVNMSNTSAGAAARSLGEMGVQDYLSLVKRRMFWIIFPALAVLIAATVLAWRLPNIYRSEAIILVQPQKVPTSYFPTTVTSGADARMATIYQEVTSLSRLKRIMDSLNLYPDIRAREGNQYALLTMAKAISVDPITAMGTTAPAIRISYRGSNPAQTAQVTNQITAMFIEENLRLREEQSYGTSDFLESELQKTAQQLEEKGKELAEVKAKYGRDLPESMQFRLQEMAALREQLHNAEQQINQDQQQAADLQSLETTTTPTVDLDLGASLSGSQSPTADLQAKLNTLQKRYGPNHPDVRKLQAQLNEAKAKEADNPAPKTAVPSARKIHNPVIEAQLEQLDEDLEKRKTQAAQIKSSIASLQATLQSNPDYEQKIGFVQRDFDALQGSYTSLLGKRMAAQTATELESREKSERFVILDSALIPEKPYFPNRPMFVFGGLVLGVLVGFGIAVAREVLDDSVRNSREAERILGAPVLSGVPEILTVQQLWQSTLRLGALAAATLVVAVVVGFGLAQFSARFL
jgi:polysaccharide chain length determinant protein (PEP-CTERM system associated)